MTSSLLRGTALALLLSLGTVPGMAQDVNVLIDQATAAAQSFVDGTGDRAALEDALNALAQVDPVAAQQIADQVAAVAAPTPAPETPAPEAPAPEAPAVEAPATEAPVQVEEVPAPEAPVVEQPAVAPEAPAVAPETLQEQAVPEVQVEEVPAVEQPVEAPVEETTEQPIETPAEQSVEELPAPETGPEAQTELAPAPVEQLEAPAADGQDTPVEAPVEGDPVVAPEQPAPQQSLIEGETAPATENTVPTDQVAPEADASVEATGTEGDVAVDAATDAEVPAATDVPINDAAPSEGTATTETPAEQQTDAPVNAEQPADTTAVPADTTAAPADATASEAAPAEATAVEPGANDTDVIELSNSVEEAEAAIQETTADVERLRTENQRAIESGDPEAIETTTRELSEAQSALNAAEFDLRTLNVNIVNENTVTTGEAANPDAAPVQRPTVLPDELTDTQRQLLAAQEELRREQKRRRRAELIGAAAAGVAVGAIVPQLGGRVVEDQGDLIVIERDGEYFVRRDENELLRDRAENFEVIDLGQGLTETQFTFEDGSRVVTVRDAGGNVLRRSRILADGSEYVLFDDSQLEFPDRPEVYTAELPELTVSIPRERYIVEASVADETLIEETFLAEPVETTERVYPLAVVRESERIRDKVRRVDLDQITFDTGSAAVRRSQLPFLDEVGIAMNAVIAENPGAVFLIEGHTDAVGSDISNLTLSDRRAETVAALLTDRYGVPAENLVVEGYGERYLKIDTEEAERQNRRVTVRNITPLVSASR